MARRAINLLQLYPKAMNIYGDWGNTLVLKRRLEWHGYEVNLFEYNVGDKFPDNVDIIVGGGGQDSGQQAICKDLESIGPRLIALANDNVPMLMICGLYQLFGHSFTTHDGTEIPGIGLFDLKTVASPTRMIGNIVEQSPEFGEIIGYENHSGQTFLGANVQPLATVLKGAGNNGQDHTEGARYKNVVGSYLHGSLLPKNPALADWIITQALERAFGDAALGIPDDRFAEQARQVARKRPR